MGPKIETCGELLDSLRMLLATKQFAMQNQFTDRIPYAASGLLTELVARGECRASDLAHHRIVDASVISRQVAQLEQAGLLTRRPDPDDRRVSLLRATAEGEGVVRDLERSKAQWIRDALVHWDDESVEELAGLMDAAMRDLRRHSFPEAEELPERRSALYRAGTADAADPDTAAGAEAAEAAAPEADGTDTATELGAEADADVTAESGSEADADVTAESGSEADAATAAEPGSEIDAATAAEPGSTTAADTGSSGSARTANAR
ncbi:hypothetical protein GCM10027174_41940 [Salinifilum aidingensis]